MNFYNEQHQFYCGIDLHSRQMYVCVMDQQGKIHLHRNIRNDAHYFLKLLDPFRCDVVVGSECIYNWYWLADLCAVQNIPFVLGHALYMRAIHGAKAKNDRIDSEKITLLLRAGMLPQAYVYPQKMRATRDLMRRRTYLVRIRADILSHIQLTNHQYNLPAFNKNLSKKHNRLGLVEHFPSVPVQQSIKANESTIDHLQQTINQMELFISSQAKEHDPNAFRILRSTHGIGKVLSLTILYEIENIHRFPSVGDFLSYARLVKCAKESAGKRYGSCGKKIGNVHLKWAFSEAAVLFLRQNELAQKWYQKSQKKHGKGKALSILAAKLGRCVYFMLKRQRSFDMNKFFSK
jgi:transposase